ncbi:MAG: response regulator transcription factor [Caulobacteraceae bacterium]
MAKLLRRRVYVVAGASGQRRRTARVLGDAGYEVKKFASSRAFTEVAAIVAAGCVLTLRTSARRGGPSPERLTTSRADLPVIVLTAVTGDVAQAVETIKGGAVDFIETAWGDARLLAAVEVAHIALERAETVDRQAEVNAARIAEMSSREREVLERLLSGGTNKTIGRELGISPRTVEIHRARAMERLGAHNLPQAVRLALAAGLEPPDGEG